MLLLKSTETNCDYCGGATATIRMVGYGDDDSGDCNWCSACALRLARNILEDLCQLSGDPSRMVVDKIKT